MLEDVFFLFFREIIHVLIQLCISLFPCIFPIAQGPKEVHPVQSFPALMQEEKKNQVKM